MCFSQDPISIVETVTIALLHFKNLSVLQHWCSNNLCIVNMEVEHDSSDWLEVMYQPLPIQKGLANISWPRGLFWFLSLILVFQSQANEWPQTVIHKSDMWGWHQQCFPTSIELDFFSTSLPGRFSIAVDMLISMVRVLCVQIGNCKTTLVVVCGLHLYYTVVPVVLHQLGQWCLQREEAIEGWDSKRNCALPGEV